MGGTNKVVVDVDECRWALAWQYTVQYDSMNDIAWALVDGGILPIPGFQPCGGGPRTEEDVGELIECLVDEIDVYYDAGAEPPPREVSCIGDIEYVDSDSIALPIEYADIIDTWLPKGQVLARREIE